MLDDFEVPDYLERDHRDIIREEEKQYAALKNVLIEMETGAINGIRLLRQ